MNGMRFHLLRLAGIGAVAIAVPQLASASDDASAVVRLVMGPMSAAQKNQGGHDAISENKVPGCSPSKGTCGKPHHRTKQRRAARR
jgi:hypothetical protein